MSDLLQTLGAPVKARAEMPQDWEPITTPLKFSSEGALIASIWSGVRLTEAVVVLNAKGSRCQIWRKKQPKIVAPERLMYGGFVRTR